MKKEGELDPCGNVQEKAEEKEPVRMVPEEEVNKKEEEE